VPSPPDELHQVDRALRVLARVGVPPVDGRLRLAVPDAAHATARRVLAEHGVTGPYAVLLPGASCSSRRYPVDRFAEVAGLLAAAGLPVLVSGTAAESEPVGRVARNRPGVLAAAGELDVPALAAALAGARVVVCNNSGGAHLADAVGVPAVVLFAGTEQPDQFRPRRVPAAVLTVPTPCAPCRQLRCPYGLECLDLAPERVAREALRLAGQGVPSGAGARDRIRSMMADVDRSGT
jgi:ADP-heptose:LPS heptosyltransferase